MRVLVTEDDPVLAAFLKRYLDGEGYDVQLAADGAICLEQARSEAFDLVLLDLNLPVLDGAAVLQQLQKGSSPPAIIVVTGRTAIRERIECLDRGADDFILKPFNTAELAARCRAALRRRERGGNPGLQFGELHMNRLDRTVQYRAGPVELTPREFALLEVLMLRQGGCCSREELLKRVWRSASEASTNVVDVYVNYIRHKLAAASGRSGGKSPIETVRGHGYRLASLSCPEIAETLPSGMVFRPSGA